MLLFKNSKNVLLSILSIFLIMCFFQGCGDNGDKKGGGSNNNYLNSISTMKFSSISSGGYHTCGLLLEKNTPVCWGATDKKQSFDFDKARNIEFSKISAGGFHTCGIKKSDGQLVCWGSNRQRDFDPTKSIISYSPKDVVSKGFDSYVIKSDDTVEQVIPNEQALFSDKKVKSLSAGGFSVIAILASNDTVEMWGDTSQGQGKNFDRVEGKKVKAISAGAFHNLAIMNDDTVEMWGDTSEDQDKNFDRVKGKKVKAISAGGTHSAAIMSDQTVAMWGSTIYNEEENFDRIKGKKVKAISAGGGHTCALTPDDYAICWGEGMEEIKKW